MEIHITGQHIEITESLKSYVEEKFEKKNNVISFKSRLTPTLI